MNRDEPLQYSHTRDWRYFPRAIAAFYPICVQKRSFPYTRTSLGHIYMKSPSLRFKITTEKEKIYGCKQQGCIIIREEEGTGTKPGKQEDEKKMKLRILERLIQSGGKTMNSGENSRLVSGL